MTAQRDIRPGSGPGMMGSYDASLIQSMASLYRARPFTRAIPFQKDMSTVSPAGNGVTLWTPENASFELGLMRVISSVGGEEFALCDTTPQNPFVFFVPSALPADHITVDLQQGYRSIISYQSAKLILVNPANSTAILKGILYGWEFVAQAGGGAGYYRG